MNYSYLMGVKDVSELRNSGFIIEEIDRDYGIIFTKDKEMQYEEFLISVVNLLNANFHHLCKC